MLPITNLISCTDPLDEFDLLSHHQTQHAKTYVTGLSACGSKTVTGSHGKSFQPEVIGHSTSSLPGTIGTKTNSITNGQRNCKTTAGVGSADGYIIIDDSALQRTGKFLPGAGSFYDHTEGEPVWRQDLVYAFYTDHKTSYQLAFRQFEKDECEDREAVEKTRYDLVRELITELDSWFAHDSGLIVHVESYGKDQVEPLRSNRQVEFANKQLRVDALEERIDTKEREIDEKTYNIWTKTLPFPKLGNIRLVVAEKEIDEDKNENENNPIKYLTTNKIDNPSAHTIWIYSC